jgi:periplasmic protein TonB
MRAPAIEDPNRLSPKRTVAMATALAIHVGALLFILVPSRPAAQAQLEDMREFDVVFIEEKPIPPPPPPPVNPPIPRDPPPRQPMRLPTPEPPATPTTPITTAEDPVNPDVVTDTPVSDPITPSGPPSDSFSEAHADAQYGANNRVRYPIASIKKREHGEVQLRILIGRDGRPLQVELARTSGSRELDRAAKKAVMKWRFVAAERNGEKVESWALVPIQFNLDQA